MLQLLRQTLERIAPVTDEAWAEVATLVSIRKIKAGEHLLRAGARATHAYFVKQGLFREYYLDDAGRESTRRFTGEGEFTGSLADLIGGRGAAVSIQALAMGEVWEIDWPRFDALSEVHPCLMKLMRRFAEALYVRKMRREFEMLTLAAAERYHRFAGEFRDLDARLPRHMVASYLGITPVHLSRICAAGKRWRSPAAKAGKS